MKNNDEAYVQIVPTKRQLVQQSMEFYAFFHFSVNTYTDKEWGDGTESPLLFNPHNMDADQWVRSIKKAGMKGAILTCKHHDGFCLWPSKFTTHSIASSEYKQGKGDLVREVSDALRRENLAFGIYLSPWDRNYPGYGKGNEYDDYYVNQLTELLTQYGPVFCVWMDGACGENAEGKKQQYNWTRYYQTIRTLQPDACISVCGPDIRWCGNEAGDTRESEWSVVPKELSDAEKIQSKSQHEDAEAFRQQKIASTESDLGSRELLSNKKDLIWYPAEVNTSIRPGWFYHETEDNDVKTLSELISIYEHSVGGNAMFLLNIPPMPSGRIHENDCRRLAELGTYIERTYRKNLLEDAEIRCEKEYGIETIRTSDTGFWETNKGETQAEIILSWDHRVQISRIVLMENIEKSQRIECFRILARIDSELVPVYEGTTVGYKKISSFTSVTTNEVRIQIIDSRVSITLKFLGVYE